MLDWAWVLYVCCVSMRTTDLIRIELRPALNCILILWYYKRKSIISLLIGPSPISLYNNSFFSAFSQYIEISGLCTNSSNNDGIVLIVPRCSLCWSHPTHHVIVFCHVIDQLQWTVNTNITVDCINAALSCSWMERSCKNQEKENIIVVGSRE